MSKVKVRLADVVDINPRTSVDAALESVAFLAMADVTEGGQIAQIQSRSLSEVSKGYTVFQNDDVLLAKITPCFENGKAVHVVGLFSGVGFGSTEFHVLRPSSKVDGRFLFHLIWNPLFRQQGAKRMTGSAGQKRVPTAFLADFKIELPSLSEQTRIAAILDKADKLRSRRRDAMFLADSFLRASFFHTFGDTEANGRDWPVVRMEDVALQVTDGEHQTPQRSQQGVYLLSARNIQNGYLDLGDVDYVPLDEFERIRRRCEPIRGDILISCSGSIGRVAQVTADVPMALVRSVALVRPNKEIIRSSFLEHLLRSVPMQRRMIAASKSSAQANLFQGPIRALPIMLPPMEEQIRFEKIVEHVASLSAKFDTAMAETVDLASSLQWQYFNKASSS